VLIDAVYPGGQLRNAHVRAVHELRSLQHQVMNDWRVGTLKLKNPTELAATVLQSAEKVRNRIATDLQLAQTSFAKTGKLK
jgi:hypothetical protein